MRLRFVVRPTRPRTAQDLSSTIFRLAKELVQHRPSSAEIEPLSLDYATLRLNGVLQMSDSSGGNLLLVGLFVLAVYKCSGSEKEVAVDEYYVSSEEHSRPAFDEDAARDAAKDELTSQTYSDIGSPYGCTSDCSGHEAGFAWAADGNEDHGTSRSLSFDEGQQAYSEAVDERVEEMRSEYENGQDPY